MQTDLYTQLCREMLEKKNMGEKLLNIHLINRIQSDKGLHNVSGVVLFFFFLIYQHNI